MDRIELATAPRTWRDRIGPTDVGLPTGLRRRTPGLRRDEVAQLAGMSVDHVIRLEQTRRRRRRAGACPALPAGGDRG